MKQLNTSALDVSTHNLNTSTSKHKFSFPKADRFGQSKRSLCDSYYEIPSTRAHRATSFGYGHKDIGIRDDKQIPPPATYTLSSQFNQKKRGFSFGSSRQEMILGGPLAESATKKYIPGPGNYKDYSTLILKDNNIPTIKSRLPDRSTYHLRKNPGPGAYLHEQLGKPNYYATSNHKNNTNRKISSSPPKLEPINKSTDIGPDETIQMDMKPNGRYIVSKIKDVKTRSFDKSPRQSLVYKHMLNTPSPGLYNIFSEFGSNA